MWDLSDRRSCSIQAAFSSPFVAQEKIDRIKELGREDGLVKTWLNRVIATVQEEFQRSLLPE